MQTQHNNAAPVVFIIFNRPDLTSRVFAKIRQVAPKQLFIIADGPRNEAEQTQTQKTRESVRSVDWDCAVTHIYSATNLGCKQRIYTGLNEVFKHTDRAIILEDDCLPTLSFFTFCNTLLDKYAANEAIMHITGNNFQNKKRRTPYTYFFSKYCHVWGWATWKRAWEKMDIDLASFDNKNTQQTLLDSFDTDDERDYWLQIFTQIHTNPQKSSSWAYPWTYTCWIHQGLTCYPATNLVENIGFGPSATHTTGDVKQLQVQATDIHHISHPPKIIRNIAADKFTVQYVFFLRDMRLWKRIYNFLKIRGGWLKRKVLPLRQC